MADIALPIMYVVERSSSTPSMAEAPPPMLNIDIEKAGVSINPLSSYNGQFCLTNQIDTINRSHQPTGPRSLKVKAYRRTVCCKIFRTSTQLIPKIRVFWFFSSSDPLRY